MERTSYKLVARVGQAVSVGLLLALSGCSGFFPPLPTTTTPVIPGSTTGNFVYVANQTTTGTIAAFSVATSTAGVGSLTAVAGSPFTLPYVPTAMAVTPNNSYLYVAGLGGIYGYFVNATTGALSSVGSGVLAVTVLPSVSLDVSPDGQWLMALSADGLTMNEYQINASTGALSIVATQGYAASGGVAAVPKMVKFAPNGGYVFVALGTGGDLVFPFTTSTGALGANYLTLPAGAGTGTTSDNALAVDSGTAYLYIARSGVGSGVAVYAIGAGGALQGVAGSPFAAGAGPFSVVVDGTGKYLYAGNRTAGTISGYSIGTGGVLTALAGSPYPSGGAVNSLTVEKSGKYLLAAAQSGSPDLTMYSFDASTAGRLDTVVQAAAGTDPAASFLVVATH